jgi:hypothetical protein
LGDPLKGNLLLFYKPLHLEAQQVSTRIEVRRHQLAMMRFVFLLAHYGGMAYSRNVNVNKK